MKENSLEIRELSLEFSLKARLLRLRLAMTPSYVIASAKQKRSFHAFSPWRSLLFFFAFTLNSLLLTLPCLFAGDWGSVQKKIAVQRGTAVEAWESDKVVDNSTVTRGDVTLEQFGQRAADMSPVGDGTYELKVNLFPNQEYNYIFFAEVSGVTFYDTVNSGKRGNIVLSTSSTEIILPSGATAYTASVGGGDARRILQMPDVNEGTTVYVLNNFGDAPNPPRNVRAFPGQSAVRLRWDEPDTAWCQSPPCGSMRASDVLIGGGFRVFRSTSIEIGYTDMGFVSGTTATANTVYDFQDSGLTTGVTYYYIVVSSDAYTGQFGTMKIPNLTSGVPGPGSTPQVKPKPGRPVEILFKVQDIEWEKVQRKDFVVWLTPQQFDARFYSGKLKGRIIQVYVPPDEDEEGLIDQLKNADPLPGDISPPHPRPLEGERIQVRG